MNKEVEMRLRGEKVEKVEERRRWRGIEVASVLKMFKQQKPHARHQKTVHYASSNEN